MIWPVAKCQPKSGSKETTPFRKKRQNNKTKNTKVFLLVIEFFLKKLMDYFFFTHFTLICNYYRYKFRTSINNIFLETCCKVLSRCYLCFDSSPILVSENSRSRE